MFSYIFSKLSKPTVGWINGVVSAGSNRESAFAVAVAYVISLRTALPSGEVDDPMTYFRMNHTEVVSGMIDRINELAPIQTKLVKQIIESFFLYRYSTIYPPIIPLALREGHGLEDFFSLSKYFSDEVLSIIEKDSQKVTQYINNLTTLVAEIDARYQATLDEEEKDRYVPQ